MTPLTKSHIEELLRLSEAPGVTRGAQRESIRLTGKYFDSAEIVAEAFSIPKLEQLGNHDCSGMRKADAAHIEAHDPDTTAQLCRLVLRMAEVMKPFAEEYETKEWLVTQGRIGMDSLHDNSLAKLVRIGDCRAAADILKELQS